MFSTFFTNKIPILEEITLITKNKNATITPVVGFRWSNSSPYKKVSSLSPTPPMDIGIVLTIDEKKN